MCVGGTVRHFSTLAKEYLASDRVSRIFIHLQNSEYCLALKSADCFHVLDHTSTSFQLKMRGYSYSEKMLRVLSLSGKQFFKSFTHDAVNSFVVMLLYLIEPESSRVLCS